MLPGTLTVLLLVQAAPATALPRAASPDDARRSVRAARSAVAGDTVAPARARWEAALERNAADRGALLSLGTLARLTNDSAAAARYYRRILERSPPDRFTVYARIGRAEADRMGRSLDSAAAGFTAALREAELLGERPARIQALIGLALAIARLEPADSSLAILARAERLRPAGDLALESELRCVRGPLRVTAGHSGGREDATAGLALARRLGDARLLGLCWHAVGLWTFINVDDPAASDRLAVPFASATAA